jgi:putative heme-binding domain-containing protein
VAPDGSLYVSDWVDKSYEVHGKGRIWRIRATQAVKPSRPSNPGQAIRAGDRALRERAARQLAASEGGRATLQKLASEDADLRTRAAALGALAGVGPLDGALAAKQDLPALQALAIRHGEPGNTYPAAANAPEARAELLRKTMTFYDLEPLTAALQDPDAFVRQAARHALATSGTDLIAADFSKQPAEVRLARLLVLRETREQEARKLVSQFLGDPDPAVRFCAVQWVGEERLTEFRNDLEGVLSAGAVDGRLFSAYFAALERLDGKRRQPGDEFGAEQYLARALFDERSPPSVKRAALRALRPGAAELSWNYLRALAMGACDRELRLEAVRTVRQRADSGRAELLYAIAKAQDVELPVRAEAIVGLSTDHPEQRKLLFELAAGSHAELREESLRSLLGAMLSDDEQKMLTAIKTQHDECRQLVDRVLALNTVSARTATDTDGWLKLLEGPGRPEVGARIFHHPKLALCSRCHQVDGRGGQIGPDLSAAGKALGRRRLIESILQPSREVAPQFVPWLVQTTDGRSLSGLAVAESASGDLILVDQRGEQFQIASSQIAARRPSTHSIMPDGLQRQSTAQELRDLIAYLEGER